MALKVACLGSAKEESLRAEQDCYMLLEPLWGGCIPALMLAGPLVACKKGWGLGTAFIQGRHLQEGGRSQALSQLIA